MSDLIESRSYLDIGTESRCAVADVAAVSVGTSARGWVASFLALKTATTAVESPQMPFRTALPFTVAASNGFVFRVQFFRVVSCGGTTRIVNAEREMRKVE